jgi:hypothetical protein
LGKLLRLKEQVDKDDAELQALAGQFGQAVAAETPVVKPVRRYRRRKAKMVKVVGELVVVKAAAKKDKRSQYDQTADQYVLGLFAGGKVLTSAELGEAWATAGRKGAVAKTLGKLVAEEKLARRKIKDGQGSNYSLVGAVAKPVAKKGKKTFTCPTCKKVYASGPMLGGHYKAEPTHRLK